LYHNRSAYSSGAPEITPGFQWHSQGRIQDFKLGGVHLKKLRRAEGGANIFGVFRAKNHDFTPKYHIFSNFRGRARRVRPPLDPPLVHVAQYLAFCVMFYRSLFVYLAILLSVF
jgi:hypothetical protein